MFKIYEPDRSRHSFREQAVDSASPPALYPVFFAWIANSQVVINETGTRYGRLEGQLRNHTWSGRLSGFIVPLGNDEEKGRILDWSNYNWGLRCAA